MPKNYQDMRTGVINLTGIRNVQSGDNLGYSGGKGQYTISIQYKGIANMVYYYQSKNERDEVFEEIREKLTR